MKWVVNISVLPDRAESLTVEAPSSIQALREVMRREMVSSALERRAESALCISVMKPSARMNDGLKPELRTGGLELR